MKFLIFGKPQCSFCLQAKLLLEREGFEYEYRDIVADPTQREVMFGKVKEMTGQDPRTVPQIFQESHIGLTGYVGGFHELRTLLSETDQV